MNVLTLPCRKPELFNYSPHQSSMLLLDQAIDYNLDDSTITTSLVITDSSEFLDQKQMKMPVWVSFEYMAQSIALLSGIAHVQTGGVPKIGFIMGVRDCSMEQAWFELADEVTIQVLEEFREGDVAVFEGRALVGDKLYCSAVLSVVENNKELMDQWTDKFSIA